MTKIYSVFKNICLALCTLCTSNAYAFSLTHQQIRAVEAALTIGATGWGMYRYATGSQALARIEEQFHINTILGDLEQEIHTRPIRFLLKTLVGPYTACLARWRDAKPEGWSTAEEITKHTSDVWRALKRDMFLHLLNDRDGNTIKNEMQLKAALLQEQKKLEEAARIAQAYTWVDTIRWTIAVPLDRLVQLEPHVRVGDEIKRLLERMNALINIVETHIE